MASLIRSYFERKGMHVQFNVVDRNTLIDAQNNPDKHNDLVIRVAGYSAHFTKLAKETRTILSHVRRWSSDQREKAKGAGGKVPWQL